MTEVDRGSFSDSFTYDLNGNPSTRGAKQPQSGRRMSCRMEAGSWFIQTYNAENRISSIAKLATGDCATPGNYAAKWDFTGACPERSRRRSRRDGDGVRTAQSYTPYTDGQPGTPVITRYYFGGAYETTGTAWKKYYAFAGQTVAMRDASGFKYFLSDHLGSVSVVLSATGTVLEQQRYLPFGQARVMPPYASVTSTDFTYTGQRNLPDTGLMDYRARFYSPALGRFIQPDNIIPGAANPQSWNRYSYVTNNPLRYTDPTGHRCVEDGFEGSCSSVEDKMTKKWKANNKKRRFEAELRGLTPNPNACGGPNPSVVCLPVSEPELETPLLPGPLPDTTPDIPDLDELDEWAWFTDKALEWLDYASSAEDIINTFRPVYKQVKYAFGTGGLEAIVDATLYGLKDRWYTSLTPGQRIGRMTVVGGQSFLVDRASEKVGALARPFGGKMTEIAVQYIFSASVSEYVVPRTTYWLFDNFNLGVPNDINPIR